MRYLAFLAAIAIAAPASAQCVNGQCRGPVRSIVVQSAKATARVATAPVRAVCGHAGCRCADCPGVACNCDLRPIANSSTKQRSLTRSVTWNRTRLLARIRFAPQRRWR